MRLTQPIVSQFDIILDMTYLKVDLKRFLEYYITFLFYKTGNF